MTYRFGVFEFDGESSELRKNGRVVALEPQPARALARLLEGAGDIVDREALKAAVWGSDTHVDFDRGLAYCLSQIRAALGDSGENPRFVQTIPKRGYKFIRALDRFHRFRRFHRFHGFHGFSRFSVCRRGSRDRRHRCGGLVRTFKRLGWPPRAGRGFGVRQ
jgi:DNA-binding winged helix-turn-helix (wHTH) protein